MGKEKLRKRPEMGGEAVFGNIYVDDEYSHFNA